jgi:hypothetical protein
MSETTDITEIPPAPHQPRKRRNLIIGGAVALAAAATGIAFAVNGSGPGTITVHGTLLVGPTGSGDSTNTNSAADGDACLSVGGYTDIARGATVTIGGGTGQTLAVTPLGSGHEANVNYSLGVPAGDCAFPFSVQVPAGQSAYTVTIGHRGTQTFTPAQVQSAIALSLGS